MRLLFWSILCFGLVTASEFVDAGRASRSLAFRKGSSFFFRMNFKITLFPSTTIFAQAAGFKVVWELPTETGRPGIGRPGRSVSDVHEAAELVYESHGFDGRSCLLKNVCQAMEYASQRDGVMAKILKLLVGSYANNDAATEDEEPILCDIHVRNCPLELIGIDSFIEQ
ncbi:uncharacterized protein LOC117227295 [Megalopta genalis]|uniref:uncharacterized protein LOC117227295 n=1 Tax=Megalopta genalis TaxID=115081 RepID=UPI0014430C23|nr:uncharacterized protein LOC117227295 [Megalopta genalis]